MYLTPSKMPKSLSLTSVTQKGKEIEGKTERGRTRLRVLQYCVSPHS